MAATYVKGMVVIPKHDSYYIYTSSSGDSGSWILTVLFENVEEDAVINMYWYVQAINLDENPDVDEDFENTGTIYLT
jgi:hypothetical protein